LWYSAALLLLAPALVALGADKDAFGDPLPEGAKARLGTSRGGPTGNFGSAQLLPPKFDTFLVAERNGLCLHEVSTGKITELPANANDRVGSRSIIAVSADGKRAVVDRVGTYSLVDTATGKALQAIQVRNFGFRQAVSLSADGTLFAYDARPRQVGKDAQIDVVVWDIEKNAEVARVTALQNQSVSAILSPDGKTLATFGQHFNRDPMPAPDAVRPERVVQVWDVATGKQLVAITDTTREYGTVLSAAFSPDGKTLATASGGGTIGLWELPGGKLKDTLLGRSTQGMKIAFAPDGKTLAAVDQFGALERWALPEGKPLKLTECPVAGTRTGPGRFARSMVQPTGLAFADNERVVAWGTLWNRTVAWEAPGGKLLTPVSQHLTDIQSVQFTANGEVISAGREGRIVRWDPRSGKSAIRATVTYEDDFAPTEHRIALGPDGKRGLRGPLVFDAESGGEAFRLPAPEVFPSVNFALALAVTPTSNPKNQTTPATIWNLDTRKKVVSLELPGVVDQFRTRGSVAVAFSPDNSRMVTAISSRDFSGMNQNTFTVTGWDVKSGKKLGEFVEQNFLQLTEVAAANNNSGAVLATSDGRLWVADYEKGARADTVDDAQMRGGLFRCPTFSPDGKLFAAGVPTENPNEFDVRVYSWPQGKALHTFVGHRGAITALAFSPDNKTLASGSADTTVLVWDLTDITKPK
jgi:WD40 repeat protein